MSKVGVSAILLATAYLAYLALRVMQLNSPMSLLGVI